MPIDKMLADSHWQDAAELAQRFNSAEPFRYLVMDEFFRPEIANALLDSFPAFDTRKAMNENGVVGGKCVHENMALLGEPYCSLDQMIQSRAFLDWLGQVTGIDELLYDPHYFGGGTHENRHGQDLDPHVDFNRHPKTGFHRRLNLIVYLNREWRADWGGSIEFHTDPHLPPEQNQITYVEPVFNRAVLFETTHWSWHGFGRICLPGGEQDPRSRKSLALYFYSRTRPENEQSKPHSTIYVERPLPDDIQPRVTLSEQQHQTIVNLLARRDQHLQRLYRDISELRERNDMLRVECDRSYAMVRALSSDDPDGNASVPSRRFSARARRWLARKLLARTWD